MSPRKATPLLLLASVGLAWALYAPAMDAPMVRDDLVWFRLVYPDGTFSSEAAGDVLWPDDPRYGYNNHFRPVGWLSIIADDRLLGNDVRHFRATAITLHGLLGFIVGLLAMRLGASVVGGFVAAALFVGFAGSHEPVVLPAHRFTLLSTLFLALGAMAAHRYARKGGLAAVVTCAMLAVLSKDSMLSIMFALVPFAFVTAPAGERVRKAARLTVALGAVAVADVILRKASTGSWLPALTDTSDNVVSGLDPAGILAGLPTFIGVFAGPVVIKPEDGALWTALRFAAMALIAAAVAWGLLRTARNPQQLGPGFVALMSLAALSFPVLYVDEHLDNARNFYPLAMVFFPWIAAAMGSRAPWLLLLTVLHVPMLLKNQGTYESLTPVFTSAVAETEAAARGGLPVTVMGLPPSVNGTPAFGHHLTHFPMRFHPPLHPHHRTVLPIKDELPPRPATADGPWALLSLETDARGVARTRWSARVPSDEESAAAAGLTLRRPDGQGSWPGAGPVTIVIQGDAAALTAESIIRVRLRFAETRFTWYLRLDGPGVNRGPASTTVDLMTAPSLAPVEDIAAVMTAAVAGTAAVMEVDVLPPPDADAAGPGTGPVTITLSRQ